MVKGEDNHYRINVALAESADPPFKAPLELIDWGETHKLIVRNALSIPSHTTLVLSFRFREHTKHNLRREMLSSLEPYFRAGCSPLEAISLWFESGYSDDTVSDLADSWALNSRRLNRAVATGQEKLEGYTVEDSDRPIGIVASTGHDIGRYYSDSRIWMRRVTVNSFVIAVEKSEQADADRFAAYFPDIGGNTYRFEFSEGAEGLRLRSQDAPAPDGLIQIAREAVLRAQSEPDEEVDGWLREKFKSLFLR